MTRCRECHSPLPANNTCQVCRPAQPIRHHPPTRTAVSYRALPPPPVSPAYQAVVVSQVPARQAPNQAIAPYSPPPPPAPSSCVHQCDCGTAAGVLGFFLGAIVVGGLLAGPKKSKSEEKKK